MECPGILTQSFWKNAVFLSEFLIEKSLVTVSYSMDDLLYWLSESGDKLLPNGHSV